jgi:hypothetical protein
MFWRKTWLFLLFPLMRKTSISKYCFVDEYFYSTKCLLTLSRGSGGGRGDEINKYSRHSHDYLVQNQHLWGLCYWFYITINIHTYTSTRSTSQRSIGNGLFVHGSKLLCWPSGILFFVRTYIYHKNTQPQYKQICSCTQTLHCAEIEPATSCAIWEYSDYCANR